MKKQKLYFWIGITILLVLILTYLIKIPVEIGPNYTTFSPLLGLLIFYNPIVLVAYIIVALLLIFLGSKGRVKFV